MSQRVIFVDETAQIGGAEINLLLAATSLRRAGWRATAVLPGAGPLAAALLQHGIPVAQVARPPLMPTSLYVGRRRKLPNLLALLVNAGFGAWWVARLYRHLARSEPAIVHTVSMWAHMFGGVAARLAGRPIVWHFQDIVDPRSGLGLYRKLLLLWARYIPERILCVSQKVADQFAGDRRACRKTTVLWNIVDVEQFTPVEPAAGFERGMRPLTIGTVARLTPWKGHEVALRAALLLKERGVVFRWLFAGAEALGVAGYEHYLRDLVRRWGLEQQVEFAGWVHDMPAFYRTIDVLAHVPIEPEPFGLVLAEALAAGLVVVASAGGGAEQSVQLAGGILVPPDHPQAVAAALLDLESTPDAMPARRLAARRFAEREYSVDRYISQLVDTYISLQRSNNNAI